MPISSHGGKPKLVNEPKFTVGITPRRSSQARSVSQPKLVLLDPRSARQLAIEFNRFRADSDIHYIVEFSSDLKNWRQASELIESVSVNEDLDEHETVVVFQEPGWAPKDKFVRVRIEY